MQLTERAKNVLREAAKAASQNPEHFDMNSIVDGPSFYYFESDGSFRCETTCCLAGYALYQNDPEFRLAHQRDSANFYNYRKGIAKVFDIPYDYPSAHPVSQLFHLTPKDNYNVTAFNVRDVVEFFINSDADIEATKNYIQSKYPCVEKA